MSRSARAEGNRLERGQGGSRGYSSRRKLNHGEDRYGSKQALNRADTGLSNNRYQSHVTKDGRQQDCVLDKLHRVSFEGSKGPDKKYLVEERMWQI